MRTLTTIVIVAVLLGLAAYISGVFGPATDRIVATTPEACYAATADAAGKPNPTNVPCDWKAVEGLSPGAALSGRYESASAGIEGRLVIMEQVDKPARIAVSTSGKDPRYVCTAALEATREVDMLVARVSSVTGCDVTVKSGMTPGVVTLTSSEPCNSFCNMRGSMNGDFKLIPH